MLNGGGKGAQSRAEYSVQRHDRQKSGGISTLAREEVSSKMCLERDLQKIKCAMIAHFIFCPIKNTSESILKKNGKFALQKGIDMIRKYGTVEV